MATSSQQPCYFTCVLSEALEHNLTLPTTKVHETVQGLIYEHEEFGTISEFVDFLGKTYGRHLAVGSIIPQKNPRQEETTYIEEVLTFEDVVKESNRVSRYFSARLGKSKSGRCCVALLASSSVVFMLVWLGLIRSDYEVLLIAPQSSPKVIKHLLESSKAFAICYDAEHEKLVLETTSLGASVQSLKLPWHSLQSLQKFDIEFPDDERIRSDRVAMSSTAFYFHSSGTTGLPKLIPQTHNGAVGILPKLQGLHSSIPRVSTFTTTPLYHGGIADLLRCWSAASPVWLFPEGKLPIIGPSVSTIIRRIDEVSKEQRNFPASQLGYISCVPYVLDALSKMPELIRRLCDLDAVGVGGASAPQELGDRLVADGVRLVSRFGSAECGFLLSSQRNYETDKAWNVHRCPDPKGLRFAASLNERHELVVTEDWPLVSPASHARRPFNTHDVFVPHESIPGAWQYVGRSDSQLTLSTGKKFDPTVTEDELRQSNLIEDVVIVGDDKPFASAIIFASHQTGNMQPEQRRNEIWLAVRNMNASIPSHARIEERSFVILSFEQHRRVPKNNKGGVIRSEILSTFDKELASIYGHGLEYNESTEKLGGLDDVSNFVTAIVQAAIGSTRIVKDEDDLFDCGVDSILSLQIRQRICEAIPVELRSQIPLHFVYECGTISTITRSLVNLMAKGGMNLSAEGLKNTKFQEMEDMVETYVSTQAELLSQTFEPAKQQPSEKSAHRRAVILTGGTGFLGVHLLKLLIADELVSTIFLFVRSSHQASCEEQKESARARVRLALTFHKLLDALPDCWEDKVEYIPSVLRESGLGISPALYARLVREATHVIHAAWEVNFNLPLKMFASQVEGTVNLFNLTLHASRRRGHHPASLLFCSSVACIANAPRADCATSRPVLTNDPSHAANLGYGQSKWVSENVLARLDRQYPNEVAVSILRIGQLSGDTLNGIWNLREAWPLMFESSLQMAGRSASKATTGNNASSATGNIILPDLADTTLPPLDWLPVDYAARHIWRNMDSAKAATIQNVRVLNVVNKTMDAMVTWRQVQDWVIGWAEARAFHASVMPAGQWLDGLENLPTVSRSRALVPLWRTNWVPKGRGSGNIVEGGEEETESHNLRHECMTRTRCHPNNKAEAEEEIEADDDYYNLDKAYFWRILDWVAGQS